MISYPNILLIGGNARNSGKTTLACSIIRRFSGLVPVIGLKVTRIKPEETGFHGDHSMQENPSFSIFEETNPAGSKDTSAMLNAGAEKVFYICASEDRLEEAMDKLSYILPAGSLMVCESRSLRNYLEPGVFILMMRETGGGEGKDMSEFIGKADYVCRNGDKMNEINTVISQLLIHDQKWFFRR